YHQARSSWLVAHPAVGPFPPWARPHQGLPIARLMLCGVTRCAGRKFGSCPSRAVPRLAPGFWCGTEGNLLGPGEAAFFRSSVLRPPWSRIVAKPATRVVG